jgi:hypothetical protein
MAEFSLGEVGPLEQVQAIIGLIEDFLMEHDRAIPDEVFEDIMRGKERLEIAAGCMEEGL